MIFGNGNISDRGETETPAVDLLICDREEEPDPASTLHSNDDACLKPQGRQMFEDVKWKKRSDRIATWNVRRGSVRILNPLTSRSFVCFPVCNSKEY